jgi:serine/threonine protein kinase
LKSSVAPADSKTFGKYELVERIATGGMAEIWHAHQPAAAGLVKSVVIKKVLPDHARDSNFTRMFIEEATLTVGLSHGNIAQVFDFGEVNGEYYLAMELVQGQPLIRVLRRAQARGLGALPAGLALQIVIEVCRGLHYAHTRRGDDGQPLHIIHRDVSPQNVVVSYEGQVKLVDFGIAKARLAGRMETEVGAVKGKYVYFSPEQIRGRPLDARVDVFATGVMLYELLCGRLPFDGKMGDVLRAIVDGKFPTPRSVNPRISHSLEKIVLKALATDRDKRHASALELQEELTHELYRTVPPAPPHGIAHFMNWLWRQEINALGMPTQLPKDFQEWLDRARRATPGGQPIANQHDEEPTRPDQTRTRLRRTRRAAFSRFRQLVLPVGIAFLAGAAVLLGAMHLIRPDPMEIRLTSEPSGATVSVNGVEATTPTPVRISSLPSDRSHRIEVHLPGHSPWVREVLPAPGAEVELSATLEPLLPEGAPAPTLPDGELSPEALESEEGADARPRRIHRTLREELLREVTSEELPRP